MKVGEEGWVPLGRAADRLGRIFANRTGATLESDGSLTTDDGTEHPFRAARVELIQEMQAERLPSRAHRWSEDGAPNGFDGRGRPVTLEDGTTQLPFDFWERQHAWDGTKCNSVGYLKTEADWHFLRFVSVRTVDGANPNWPDRWGSRIAGHGWKVWQWVRIAIGVEVDAKALEAILRAYSVGFEGAPTGFTGFSSKSYRTADLPLVMEGVELVRSGRAKTIHDAAKRLAPGAVGGGTEESKTRRLADQIRDALKSLE